MSQNLRCRALNGTVLNTLTPFPESFRGGVVTIGKFDGVHLGHTAILRRLLARARQENVPAICITFDPPPLGVLRPDVASPPLCTLQRKLELIDARGVDAIVVIPTTRELLEMEADAFFRRIISETLAAGGIVEGETFTFGKGRGGNGETLRSLGNAAGMAVDIVPSVLVDNHVVSSSRLRSLIQDGRMEEATRLMVRPYRLSGTVVHGAGRGRTLGFPTANLAGIETLLPQPGIYAGQVMIGAVSRRAAVHIGTIPTFDVPRPVVEVHVIDFDGDLYGTTLHVDLTGIVREIVKFDSPAALVARMREDVRHIRTHEPGILFPESL
ncbi:MAG TPA: bifunctional riboflavin kinase/FAD synthetase [Planctomycetaceae bacterium]|nr:bifunctional riboflavin kinase/FAD synthetase [Planctomycetaceae bacterium]